MEAKADKLDLILSDLAEVKAWKKRQEQEQADRLTELRNDVIQVFLNYGSTISEVLTVLKLIEVDTSSLFIRGQKSKVTKIVQTAGLIGEHPPVEPYVPPSKT